MSTSRDIINTLSGKEFEVARRLTRESLSGTAFQKLGRIGINTAFDMVKEQDEPSSEDVQGTLDDPTLDPSFEKEFFLDSFEAIIQCY